MQQVCKVVQWDIAFLNTMVWTASGAKSLLAATALHAPMMFVIAMLCRLSLAPQQPSA